MLIRITNRCNQSCKHCGIDGSGPDGAHMTRKTYRGALTFGRRLGASGVILSGGEPTLHPDFLAMAQACKDINVVTVIASNGQFFRNHQFTKKVFALCNDRTYIQITSDSRFYEETVTISPIPAPPQVTIVDALTLVFPCNRTRKNNIPATAKSPHCFNLRSATHAFHKQGYPPGRDISQAVMMLEQKGRLCAPSINPDGTIRAGEMDTCYKLGATDDGLDTISERLRTMKCNKCGLFDTLSDFHKAAVGS